MRMLRWSRVVIGLVVLLAGRAAHATWIESGDVDLVIVGSGGANEGVEAEDVEPQDDMALVSVGDGEVGEVTVVGEGSITDPKVLGNFYVYEGTGNIQSVIGTVNVWRVGTRAGAGTIGVLNVLNSSIEGGGIQVLNGTANVTASVVVGASVREGSSLYVSLGSRLGSLTADGGSNTSIVESLVSSSFPCQLSGTVVVEDSALHCREIQIQTVGGTDTTTVDFRAVGSPSVVVETTEEFVVVSGVVDMMSAVVTTGELRVGGFGAYLGIAASRWTNAAGTTVLYGGPSDPDRLVIGPASRFHELGFVRVAGDPSYKNLTVDGADTELEIEGDLRIGEALNLQGNPIDLPGNATVSNDATVIVRGTLVVRPQGLLTIESGATVYAATVENAGTINENGGTLIVPEAGSTFSGVASIAAIAWRSRRRRSP